MLGAFRDYSDSSQIEVFATFVVISSAPMRDVLLFTMVCFALVSMGRGQSCPAENPDGLIDVEAENADPLRE